MANNFWKINNGVTYTGQTTAPLSPVDGDTYYDSALGCLRAYQNGQWVNLDYTLPAKIDASSTGANANSTPLKEHLLKFTNASLVSVGGIAAQTNYSFLIVVNATGNTVQINDEDTAVTASNRILTGTAAPIDLENNAAICLVYDVQASRWRVCGGTGSGTGDTTGILETLKNHLVNSPCNLMTPSIAKTDKDVLVDGAGDVAYDAANKAYKFTNSADELLSTDLIDSAEFYDQGKDIWDTRILAHWKSTGIDTAATYEISRNGGLHFLPVTMDRVGNTELYVGDYKWEREEENFDYSLNPRSGTSLTLDNSSVQARSQWLGATYVPTGSRITSIRFTLKKNGTPAGNYRYAIYSTSGFSPASLLYATAWQSANSLTTSFADYAISVDGLFNDKLFDNIVVVVETDATYKSSYNAVTASVDIQGGASANNSYTYNGSVWAIDTNFSCNVRVDQALEDFTTLYSVANVPAYTPVSGSPTLLASYVLTKPSKIKGVYLEVGENGSISGNYRVVAKDGATFSTANTLGFSEWTPVPQTANVPTDLLIEYLSEGSQTIYLFIEGDSTYNASYSVGVNYMTFDDNNKEVYGRSLDLRLKITSSASDKYLDAFTVLYDQEVFGVSGGVKRTQQFRFMAVADNDNEFQLNYVADPDLLSVYHVESGLVFKHGAFSLQGSKIVFPANTFYNGGIETTVTLIATQNEGSSFDNSDSNSALLAASHLGSTDPSIDRSIAGRGIFLRRPDGTLREICIDDSDNIVVYSV